MNVDVAVDVDDVGGMWEGPLRDIGVGVEASPLELEPRQMENGTPRVSVAVSLSLCVYEYVCLNDFQLNQYSSFWLPRGLNGSGRPRHSPAGQAGCDRG